MAEDIHNYDTKLDSQKRLIKESEQISQENKEFAEDFWKYLELGDRGNSRVFRYISNLKQFLKYNDFSFQNWKNDKETEEKITDLLLQIKESAYYSQEYSERTKESYKSTLIRIMEYHDLETDPEKTSLLPNNLKVYTTRKDQELTDPDDLPTPSDVKKLCRQLESQSRNGVGIRNAAILLTTWETMARVSAVLNLSLGDLKFQNETVEITIPAVKDSPERSFRFHLVKDLLQYYVENLHPDPDNENAPLWTTLENQGTAETGDRISYKTYTNALRKAFEEIEDDLNCDISGQTNHIFRKGRRTYCHRAELMPPDEIKQMGGWSPNSDVDPIYRRTKDEDVTSSYLDSYDVESKEDNVERDVVPLKCGCGLINAGYRLSCRECNNSLDEMAYPDGVKQDHKDKVDIDLSAKIGARMARNPDKTLNEIKEEVLEKHGD